MEISTLRSAMREDKILIKWLRRQVPNNRGPRRTTILTGIKFWTIFKTHNSWPPVVAVWEEQAVITNLSPSQTIPSMMTTLIINNNSTTGVYPCNLMSRGRREATYRTLRLRARRKSVAGGSLSDEVPHWADRGRSYFYWLFIYML